MRPPESPENAPEATDRHHESDEAARRLERLRALYRDRITVLNEDVAGKNQPFDLSLVYPESDDVQVLVEQVTDLKACLDSFRPFGPEQVASLESALVVEYTYNSNRIEGNTLTLRETDLILNKGLTAGGKTLNEHFEAINHRNAFEYIKSLARGEEPFTERDLKTIHSLILRDIDRNGAGVYRRVPVTISGSRHVPVQPYLIEKAMEDYFRYYDAARAEEHPVILAANMHEKLVTVHPFIDGNGRTARLVMNLMLLRTGYPIAVLSGDFEDRMAYYGALEAVNMEDNMEAFHRLILKHVKAMAFRYLEHVSVSDVPGKGAYFFDRLSTYLKEAGKDSE